VLAGNTGVAAADMAQANDDDIDDWLLTDCSDAQHGAGSCRMGPYGGSEAASVVDAGCGVRGVENLWVIDASVMPLDCRANTNFTTIMIAEKMADKLRGRPPLST
jgi:choline dehydrogenase